MFTDVPDEILLRIFSYLRYDYLCQCGRVCKRWYAVSKEDCLKIFVDVSERTFSPESFINFAAVHCTQTLIDLRLREMKFKHYETLKELLTRLPALRKLTLKYGAFIIREATVPISKQFNISFMPNHLIHLSLRGSSFDPGTFFGENANECLPLLCCLDLGECPTVCQGSVERVCKFDSLSALYLDTCASIELDNFYDTNPANFMQWVLLLSAVHTLDLECILMKNEVVSAIIDNCASLKELYVGGTFINDDAFSKVTKKPPYLHTLCIRDTGVSIAVMLSFFSEALRISKIIIYNSWQSESIEELKSFSNIAIINSFANEKCYHYKQHNCVERN